MPANKNGDKPAAVDFNLDTIERDGDAPEPFVFTLDGERFETVDVGAADWRSLADADENNPDQMLGMILGDKQYAKFRTKAIPAWKIGQLLIAYRKHVTGLESGESGASSVG